MINKRVKISSIISSQLPRFIREDYPLLSEFLSEYYNSLDGKGLTNDILQNIDQYFKLDNLVNLTDSTVLVTEIQFDATTIEVTSTAGFPESDGLLQIEDEIIYYKSKTDESFVGCIRGFSGITSYENGMIPGELTFSTSVSASHPQYATVQNLSILFLKQFFKKIKKQILPGFENLNLYSDVDGGVTLNQKNFIPRAKDFYSTKGTDASFDILFKALYGDPALVIKPRDFLIRPSDSEYSVTKDIIVESIIGNPLDLYNRTLFQTESQGFKETFATVTKVEEIIKENITYYILSLDFDYDKDINVRGSIFGDFSIHPKTKCLEEVQANSNQIIVDSTIGFPDEGELIVKAESGNDVIITYTSKNTTQFLGCTNITENILIAEDINLNVYAYSKIEEDEIRVRILGVVKNIELPNDTRYFEPGETISFDTLGKTYKDFKFNHWIVDVPNTYQVLKFENESPTEIRVYTKEIAHINAFDNVHIEFFDSVTEQIRTEVFQVRTIAQDRKSFFVGNPYNIGRIYHIRKLIKKYITLYSNESIVNNIQNIYGDDSNNVYVTSQGIPDYVSPDIEKRNFSIDLYGLFQKIPASSTGIDCEINNGTFSIDISVYKNQVHDFRNGDVVRYVQNESKYTLLSTGETINLNLYDGLNQNQIYYVQNVSSTELRLYRSRSNIYFSQYSPIKYNRVLFPNNLNSSSVTETQKIDFLIDKYFFQSNQFVFLFDAFNNFEVWYYSYSASIWEKINLEITGKLYKEEYLLNEDLKNLANSNSIKKISLPETPLEVEETRPGSTGILVNGVEILNYKSEDFVYYGPIERIDINSPGEGYDVINLPTLGISTERTNKTPAKAYVEVTGKLEKIDVIDGGFDYVDIPILSITGGNGIGAEAKANLVTFKHEVDIVPIPRFIDLTNNIISFSTYHKFRDYEKVIYDTNGNPSIGGISTLSEYYVTVQSDISVKLHRTESDAIDGIAINLTSYGSGAQKLVAKEEKRKISSITVTNPGENYRNNYIPVKSVGINTYNGTITALNHGYKTGDIVDYSCTGSYPSGLPKSNYYVTIIDEDNFKLSPIGTGQTSKDYYFKTNQYSQFSSSGIGTHIFKHEPIKLTVTGKIGISSYSKQLFEASLNPVFRGSISNVYIQDGGIGYGSSEILNYEKQPTFEIISSGKDAQFYVNVLNGTVTDVYVINSGSNYNGIPDLVVRGSGVGCILTPKVVDGKIQEVFVVNGGSGYEQKNTVVDIINYGKNAAFRAKIKSWNINLVSRLFNSNNLLSPDDGFLYAGNDDLKYSHIYCPNELRKKIYSQFIDPSGNLISRPDYDNSTSTSKYHSPIIGWAYDGNPIYGPYGYENPFIPGTVRRMIPGYELMMNSGRPPQSVSGKTIFPIGIFVEDYYFSGNGDLDECNGRYCVTPEYPNGTYAYFITVSDDELSPKFPYIIGKYYRSKTISDNFDTNLTQNNFDYTKNNLVRNTYFYSIDKEYSDYQFLVNPNKSSNQDSKINSTYYASVDAIGIITAGNDYSVNDRINFTNKDSKGFGVDAIVETIQGKSIVSIANSYYSLSDLELYSLTNNSYTLAISNQIHELNNLDSVNIIGNSNLESSRKINSFVQVGIKSQFLTLTSNVNNSAQTGIVTYFDVEGILDFPYIIENDSYNINGEVIKILKVDKNSSKIQVLRSAFGPTHDKNSSLVELTRKFTFQSIEKNSYPIVNREYYFNPAESIGIGTSGSLVSVEYLGTGTTTLLIPAKNFYIKNHNIQTNTPLVYSTNGGNSIKVSNGSSIFDLQLVNPIYAINFSNDFIGISSSRVSIGTDRSYVGIGTTIPTLSIVNYGTGVIHSFKTNYGNVVKARLEKNKVTVSTSSTHGLSNYDFIDISVNSGISTTVKIEYIDSKRRLVCNRKQFDSVNVLDNIFQINDHNYYTGEPLLYKAISTVSPLINEKIYYVIVIDRDRFKLATSLYDATILNKEINIISSSSGYLYQINPKINLIENQKVIFDLSSTSLSFTDGFDAFSAFDFDIYYDNNFNKKYYHDLSKKVNVFKYGKIGLDVDARLELNVTKDTPKKLYYKLTPVPNSDLPVRKKQAYIDLDSIENNSISIIRSKYSGEYNVVGIGSTQFEYQIKDKPEQLVYNSGDSDLHYFTNSNSAIGPINSLSVNSGGRYYTKLPGISSITSKYGNSAVLYPISNNIGKIKSSKINELGCWYSVDPTLRPSLVPPRVLRIEPFSTIDEITTIFKGKFYNYSPTLKVIDPSTNIVQDVILDFDYLTGKTKIIKNSSGFNDVEPKIVSINNSNGIGISTVFYDIALKRVTVLLNSEFINPDEFPVEINDEVLIENISIVEKSQDFEPDGIDYIGYNSDEYAYASFKVVGFNTTVNDDAAYITYDIGDYIKPEYTLGTFDSENSRGSIIPVKNTPKFKVKIKKNSYLIGEEVKSAESIGYVDNWDQDTNYIKIKTTSDFTLNSLLVGSTSGSIGTIQEIINFESNYDINYFSINVKGWQNQTGFLNVNSQRIHDSDYYQYFSYSIRSRIPIDTWKDTVNSLNHTSGFKQFSDLSIEPQDLVLSGIATDQNLGSFTGISDLNTVIDLETTYDFDLGSEESVFRINYEVASDEITFNSAILQDYSQSIGNRALVIDDISGEFNTNRKSTFVTAIDI